MKLKQALEGRLAEQELEVLVGGYDVVGDIAITIIPSDLIAREKLIGETILRLNRKIQVVAKRDGNYSGEFRTIPLKVIAGEDRKETLHKEHSVRFYLNPEQVYFSVRSSHERLRLAKLVREGEDVLVMFSGIGSFPLVLAANSAAALVVGVEKNPVAHEYAVKNLKANRKIRNVSLFEGDVLDQVPLLGREFDRIAMPLPRDGHLFLETALMALKRGGMLHFYDFQQPESFGQAVEKVRAACERHGRKLVNVEPVVCGHCGPRTHRLCVDALIG